MNAPLRVGTKVAELSLDIVVPTLQVMSPVTHHTVQSHPGHPVAQFDNASETEE